MSTSLKRNELSRAVLGRSIFGGVVVALLLTGIGGPVTGFLAVPPALAQDRHDEQNHDQNRDRDHRNRRPEYRPAPYYAPPPVVYAPPPPSPAIDFIFPINIR